MPFPTLLAMFLDLSLYAIRDALDDVTLPMRERVGDVVGSYAGELFVRYPREGRAVLAHLERAGVRGAGWALVALDLGDTDK